jgi:hypothetical protein
MKNIDSLVYRVWILFAGCRGRFRDFPICPPDVGQGFGISRFVRRMSGKISGVPDLSPGCRGRFREFPICSPDVREGFGISRFVRRMSGKVSGFPDLFAGCQGRFPRSWICSPDVGQGFHTCGFVRRMSGKVSAQCRRSITVIARYETIQFPISNFQFLISNF